MKLLSRRPSVVVLANVIANVSKIVGRGSHPIGVMLSRSHPVTSCLSTVTEAWSI